MMNAGLTSRGLGNLRNKTDQIVLTAGEPAGIGPDIAIAVAERTDSRSITVLVDPELMDERARQLGSSLRCEILSNGEQKFGQLKVKPLHSLGAPVRAGVLDTRNAQYVHDCIRSAAAACMAGEYAAMVTAPVHKGIINDAGIPFSGHTELIAEVCGGVRPVMMLSSETLRVALVTTHLPLSRVAASITRESLEEIIDIVHKDLQSRFGLKSPRILVCGLNPHAGEGGHLGREEIDLIEPCLNVLRDRGMDIVGPIPADTAFAPHRLSQVDIVVAMYHDQGLPVIKAQGFGHIVNTTLGLPIVRTSVDHGTALELAGSGTASASSLLAAIKQAQSMINATTVPETQA